MFVDKQIECFMVRFHLNFVSYFICAYQLFCTEYVGDLGGQSSPVNTVVGNVLGRKVMLIVCQALTRERQCGFRN